MKILVFAHDLVMCGTTVNAIELAACMREDHGHELVFFATPGPMAQLVEESGLQFVPAPPARMHPSPSRMFALRNLVRRERPDLIHVWEWRQMLDVYFIEHLLKGTPMLLTDMSMSVHWLLPKTMHKTFGTPELVEQARAAGHRNVAPLLPPVDVRRNAPRTVDGQSFRTRYHMVDRDINVVTVSRLDASMKAESLLRTVDAIRTLGHKLPLRFVIVGDGDTRARIQRRADEANAYLGRKAVTLTGALLDPRAAYAAADIVIGMGSSALRGMAFGKPTVIVGKRGFSAPFVSETAHALHHSGMFGVGGGGLDNAGLVEAIESLTDRLDQLDSIGRFSREFVVRHYALEGAAKHLAALYLNAAPRTQAVHEPARDSSASSLILESE